MLDEEMGASDLAIQTLLVDSSVSAELGSVVLAHVVLQALAVGALWRLPS